VVDIGALSNARDRFIQARRISDTLNPDSRRAEQPSGFQDYSIKDGALRGRLGN
jgi:hypothetical protein